MSPSPNTSFACETATGGGGKTCAQQFPGGRGGIGAESEGRLPFSIYSILGYNGVLMLPAHRVPPHPGEVLLNDFLVPLGITQTTLAQKLRIRITRINEIVNGKRRITPETAWLFAGAFGTSPEFWMNLQVTFDLAKTRPERLIGKLRPNGNANVQS